MNWLRIWTCLLMILLVGCGKQATVDIGAWAQTERVAKSSDSLATSFSLYKWNNTLLALGGDSGTFACRVLSQDAKTWKTLSTVDPRWIPMDADPRENRLLISRATLLPDNLNVQLTLGSITSNGEYVAKAAAPFRIDKAKLFGTTEPGLKMSESEQPLQIAFPGATVKKDEIRIPYCIAGVVIRGNEIGGDTSANGVFSSSNGGQTWTIEPISNFYSSSPVVCQTKGFYYFFAIANPGPPLELWYSRSPVSSGSWSDVVRLDKKFASNLSVPNLRAVAENETVHLCWLDSRHEKSSFSLSRPRGGNYEVAYCRRSDTDFDWSEDVILSKGLRYAYAPSISVEGEKLVVAWAGAKRDGEGRNEWNASDIYYVVSKDSGKTWTKPFKVTDRFKEGVTSGRPQVALLNGVIHLFYIQGKINYKEVSAGMVRLNQPPWPIYYTQRPFPD